jgi:hypothetical protein
VAEGSIALGGGLGKPLAEAVRSPAEVPPGNGKGGPLCVAGWFCAKAGRSAEDSGTVTARSPATLALALLTFIGSGA